MTCCRGGPYPQSTAEDQADRARLSQSVEGVASEVIITVAQDAGMDLIVMGTHGRTI